SESSAVARRTISGESLCCSLDHAAISVRPSAARALRSSSGTACPCRRGTRTDHCHPPVPPLGLRSVHSTLYCSDCHPPRLIAASSHPSPSVPPILLDTPLAVSPCPPYLE